MAAHKDNKYASKLKTKEIKDKVYKDYCDHIAKGYPRQAWCYEKNGLTLTQESMEKYIKEDKDIDASHKQRALSKALKLYVEWGWNMMHGRVKNPQPAIYQIFMRNIFNWDKDTVAKEESKGAFNKWLDKVKG